MSPTTRFLLLGLPMFFVLSSVLTAAAFQRPLRSPWRPSRRATTTPCYRGDGHSATCATFYSPSSTTLFMGKKKKPSMAERRKRRAKRTPTPVVERPAIWDELPPTDSWESVEPTTPLPSTIKDDDAASDKGREEVAAEASSLVNSQRRSVDSLTFFRRRVEESFPAADAVEALSESGYFVHDGFLSGDGDTVYADSLIDEMLAEGSSMLSNDLLELDVTRIGDGEYVGRITGGDRYVDCPRLTECVVSLTRHLPPLLNKQTSGVDAPVTTLDASASMGSLRMYDRKARLNAESLLKAADDSSSRPLGVVCEDQDGKEDDARRITALLFLTSKEWDAPSCGGGLTMEKGGTGDEGNVRLGAVYDRLILLKSDTCFHRQEAWMGKDEQGMMQAGCIAVHFVEQR